MWINKPKYYTGICLYISEYNFYLRINKPYLEKYENFFRYYLEENFRSILKKCQLEMDRVENHDFHKKESEYYKIYNIATIENISSKIEYEMISELKIKLEAVLRNHLSKKKVCPVEVNTTSRFIRKFSTKKGGDRCTVIIFELFKSYRVSDPFFASFYFVFNDNDKWIEHTVEYEEHQTVPIESEFIYSQKLSTLELGELIYENIIEDLSYLFRP